MFSTPRGATERVIGKGTLWSGTAPYWVWSGMEGVAMVKAVWTLCVSALLFSAAVSSATAQETHCDKGKRDESGEGGRKFKRCCDHDQESTSEKNCERRKKDLDRDGGRRDCGKDFEQLKRELQKRCKGKDLDRDIREHMKRHPEGQCDCLERLEQRVDRKRCERRKRHCEEDRNGDEECPKRRRPERECDVDHDGSGPDPDQPDDPEQGNNGVGNGEDPQPPGDPPQNDGPGTGRGNPGDKKGKGGKGVGKPDAPPGPNDAARHCGGCGRGKPGGQGTRKSGHK